MPKMSITTKNSPRGPRSRFAAVFTDTRPTFAGIPQLRGESPCGHCLSFQPTAANLPRPSSIRVRSRQRGRPPEEIAFDRKVYRTNLARESPRVSWWRAPSRHQRHETGFVQVCNEERAPLNPASRDSASGKWPKSSVLAGTICSFSRSQPIICPVRQDSFAMLTATTPAIPNFTRAIQRFSSAEMVLQIRVLELDVLATRLFVLGEHLAVLVFGDPNHRR